MALPWRNATVRRIVFQAALLAALAVLGWLVVRNVSESLADRRVSVSFAFLLQRAGFDIPFRLIGWTTADSYGRALWVCFLNTLLAAALGIVVSTALGLLLGIMRLSENWLVRNVALGVVEIVRNTPQLLQIVFWYVVVIQSLPAPRAGIHLPGGSILSVRGLVVPIAVWSPNAPALLGLAGGAALAAALAWRWRGGSPWFRAARLAALAGSCGLLVAAVETIQYPVLRGFNFVGGFTVPPELIALVAGLSIYSSAFIAEIVRGSVEGIARGQGEAAQSLGLSRMQTLFLVVLPQALRIMVPQVTGQYLNLTKSTSLGAAVAYPELVQIFAGTVLNQSGRAIESMVLVMGVFLAINLVTTALMDVYNRRVAIVER
jgi:general L-amino acid transport system permease protein